MNPTMHTIHDRSAASVWDLPADADTPDDDTGQECEAMRWGAMDGDGQETSRVVRFWNRVMAGVVLLFCTLAISCAVISVVRYWGVAQ